MQIQLTEGTLNLRVQRLGRDEVFEVDTPNQAFSVTQPGQYRVEAGADGNSSMVIVRQGQGEVTGGGRTYNVHSGQSGTFTGTDSVDGYVSAAGDPDDFDNWGQSRDRQYDGSQSARYVSRDVVGLRRPGQQRHMAFGPDLWQRLDADVSSSRMGALSQWSLGMDCSLGLDLG